MIVNVGPFLLNVGYHEASSKNIFICGEPKPFYVIQCLSTLIDNAKTTKEYSIQLLEYPIPLSVLVLVQAVALLR